jgi:hypothetical protein
MVRFKSHALKQMAKRNISRQEVEAVLADHDASYPSGTSDRHCYVKTINGRRIQVVVEPYDHELVVTAYEQLEQS